MSNRSEPSVRTFFENRDSPVCEDVERGVSAFCDEILPLAELERAHLVHQGDQFVDRDALKIRKFE